MQKQNIEPVILVLGHEHPHAVAPELKVHARILDVTDTIQTELRVALAEENWLHGYTSALRFGVTDGKVNLAHVVHEAGDGEHVESTEGAFLRTDTKSQVWYFGKQA